MSNNVELRYNTWFATLHVPKDVRDRIGKSKFFKSLETSNKKIACDRAKLIIGEWKAEIAKARGNLDSYTIEALRVNKAIKEANSDNEKEALTYLADDIAEKISRKMGEGEAKSFMDVATGKKTPIEPLLDGWEASLNDVKDKTRYMFRGDVQKLNKRFKNVESLSKRNTKIWISELSETLSAGTIKRLLTACSSFWKYLQTKQIVDIEKDSPFQGFKLKSDAVSYKPFDVEDLVSLYKKAEADDKPLADLIKLASYTGARLEELCQLRLEDVTQSNSLKIREAKTKAGVREVPIHSKIIELVNRLKSESKDGFLIPSSSKNKLGKRGDSLGKRFGRLKTDAGFGKEHVFHSIRKILVTLLEQAKVSENITADIVGHEKPRITYGLYSGGNTLEDKREAIERIHYPF